MFPKAMSAVLLLCVGSLACGQSVKLPAAVSTDPGTPVPLVADADGKGVTWMTPDKGLTVIDGGFFGGDSKRAMVFGSVPGVYRLWAITAKGDLPSPIAECLVTIRGSVPPVPPVPPGPGPQPDPPKPDPIVAGKLYVVIIEETRNAVISRGVWFADRGLEAAMKAKGHKWRVVDKDVTNAEGQTPADVKRFVDDAKAKTLPMLYLVNEAGKTVYSGAAPVEVPRLLELLTKFGG